MNTNIFIRTLSCFRKQQRISEIAKECKNQLKINIFRSIHLRVGDIIDRFFHFQKKYKALQGQDGAAEWREDEKKVFLCFLLGFCRLHIRKISQITDQEWTEFSKAFWNKNYLILKYEGRAFQKYQDRVRWHKEEELYLSNYIKLESDIKWSQVSKNLFVISKGQYYKSPKQCSQHWFNYLNKQIQVGQWDTSEDIIILQSVLDFGHKWAKIVDSLQKKRTQHMVKNRYYSIVKSFIRSNQHKGYQIRKNQKQIVKNIVNQLNKKTVFIKNCLNSQIQQSIKLQQGQLGQIKQQKQVIYKEFFIKGTENAQMYDLRNSVKQKSSFLSQKQQSNRGNTKQQNNPFKDRNSPSQKTTFILNQCLFNNPFFYQMDHLNFYSTIIYPIFQICHDSVNPV